MNHNLKNGLKYGALILVFLGLGIKSRGQNTFFVSNGNNSGPGTLRAAIANAVSGDIIFFDFDGLINLDSSEISINEGIEIDASFNDVTIDGANNIRIFNITSTDTVTIRNLHFQNGNSASFGGAIRSNGPLHLLNCTFQNNSAESGGAVASFDSSSVYINCRFLSNESSAQSGAVYLDNNESTFMNCIFWSNKSGSFGGAMSLNTGAASTVINCSFANNNSALDGGAIWIANTSQRLRLYNSILFGNTADPDTGANEIKNDGVLQARNSIIGDLNGSNLVAGIDNIINYDPLFTDAANGDLSLQAASPAHTNADINLVITNSLDADFSFDLSKTIDYDIDLNPRLTCNYDMGAIESFEGEITVINNNDSGVGSLRSALECTNFSFEIDKIKIRIPGVGPHQIALESNLPTVLDEEVSIDASMQEGYVLDQPNVTVTETTPLDFLFSIAADNFSMKGLKLTNLGIGSLVELVPVNGFTFSDNTLYSNTSSTYLGMFGVDRAIINNNIFGIDSDGTISNSTFPLLVLVGTTNSELFDNTLLSNSATSLISMSNRSNNNIIRSNLIGTNDQGVNSTAINGVFIFASDNNLLTNNTISNNEFGIVVSGNSQRNTFSENNYQCNSSAAISLEDVSNGSLKAPIINMASTSLVSGTAAPNSLVEIYILSNIDCPGADCQGDYFTTVITDRNGNWSFNPDSLPSTTVVTAKQIDVQQNSSPFPFCVQLTCDMELSSSPDTISCLNPEIELRVEVNKTDITYEWSGPGSLFSSDLPNPLVSKPGTYTVTITEDNGCILSTSMEIVVDTVAPEISLSADTLDCFNTEAQLMVMSNSEEVLSYTWSGPDGFSSNLQSPEVSVAGTYSLTVSAINGCTSVMETAIVNNLTDPPNADFNFDNQEGLVSFTDLSTNEPSSWQWDFGDGQVSTEQNPTIKYRSCNDFEVRLIVSNSCGSDTVVAPISITEIADAINIRPDQVSGAPGDILSVPIRVNNFTDISSLQFSITIADGNVARIVGVDSLNLSGLDTIEDFFQPDPTTLLMVWSSGPTISLEDSSALFNVQVELLSSDSACTQIQIGNDPLFAEVGQLDTLSGTIVPAPLKIFSNEICIIPLASISGQIYREMGDPLKDVMVNCSDQVPFITGMDGNYEFQNLTIGSDYLIRPERNTDLLDGVTSLDLALIQRHILTIERLNSPYKIIAADVDYSNRITAIDLANIQRLILGRANSFPNNNPSWRFIEAAYVFPDPTNPLSSPFPEEIELINLQGDTSGLDFIGMKLGDVNETSMGRPLNDPFLLLIQEEEEEEFYSVSFRNAKKKALSAYQLEISYESEALEFLGMEKGSLEGIDEQSFHQSFNDLGTGIISTLWFDPYGRLDGKLLEEGDVLFKLKFKKKRKLSQKALIQVGARRIPNLAYLPNGLPLAIEVEESKEQEWPAINSSSIHPNPFINSTNLNYFLSKGGKVNIEIRDALGRLIKTENLKLNAGAQIYEISAMDLGSPGWYIVKISTGNTTLSKKVILQR